MEDVYKRQAFGHMAKRVKERDLSLTVFSGYTYERLMEMAAEDEHIRRLLELTDILIDGDVYKRQVLAYSDSEGVSTADLSVSFIRPFLGDSYIVKTEIIHLGRSLVRVRATAYDEGNGKALASATSNFVHVK